MTEHTPHLAGELGDVSYVYFAISHAKGGMSFATHERSKQAMERKKRVIAFVSPFQFSASIIQDCLKAAKTDCSGLLSTKS